MIRIAQRARDEKESPKNERFVQALELCLRTGKPFGPFPFVRKVEEACGSVPTLPASTGRACSTDSAKC